jgi:hypothetical protein
MHEIIQNGREVEEEMEEGGEEEDKEPIATADVGMRKMKTKDKVTSGGSRAAKWKTLEDMCLWYFWKVASIDPPPL